jgi:hypothetical protein
VAAEASLARLAGCAGEIERVFSAKARARIAEVAAWSSSSVASACYAEVFISGCVTHLDQAAALMESQTRELELAGACVAAYCERFTVAPTLCGGLEVLRGADVAAAQGAAEEFLAAKLTLDLGLVGDPRISAVARAYSRFWALTAMHEAL